MQNIKELLPQREPFLFVDYISRAGLDLIVGEKYYGSDFLFAQPCAHKGEKYVPVAILLESLVQNGGAGINMSGLGRTGIFALASIDKMKVRAAVKVPAVVTMKVKTTRAAGKILKQTGSAYVGEEKVLQASWCCIFLNSK